ncbi:MAG TPA: phospholipase D-like domain-containing protein [Hyphomicrobiaceae bacterium]
MKWVKIAGLIVAVLVIAVFALMGYQYTTRGTPIRRVQPLDSRASPAISDTAFRRSVALLTRTDLQSGNHVEPLFNGNGTFPRIWQDLRDARQTVLVQLYYFQPGALADSLKRILRERSAAGVRTYVLLDAFGAQNMSDAYLDSLRSAGVRVAELRPLRWYSLNKAQHRSHVRAIIVDGRVAYTGGFGVADKWQGDGHAPEQWRETNVRFSGPAVAQLQAAFYAGWGEATGELMTGQSAFNTPSDTGGQIAGLLHAEPALGSTSAERFVVLTINGARRTLYITNSYFVPDDDFRRMLRAAARRGVDVRVLTAGEGTDVGVVRQASRYHYEELLRGGVRIYEYRPTMLHAKTIVADGQWSTIGTMNFDNRSFALNDESNLIIEDAGLGRVLERQFLDDLRFSDEIRLPVFAQRSLASKAIERLASAWARVL